MSDLSALGDSVYELEEISDLTDCLDNLSLKEVSKTKGAFKNTGFNSKKTSENSCAAT